jgi:hypothetical protein
MHAEKMASPRCRLRVLLVTVAAIGCWHRPYSGEGGLRRDTGFTRKAVIGKEEPGTFVARDGTRCVVTKERFDQVRQGEEVWCDWRTPDPLISPSLLQSAYFTALQLLTVE